LRRGRIGPHSGPYRAGFTLIELLIVVTILIMVTVAAIPLLAPGSRVRQTREGARELSAFIAGARAKALELGRPVGIWLERFPTPPPNAKAEDLKALSDTGGLHFCVNVYLAVTPLPYSGQMVGSRAVVTGNQLAKIVAPNGTVEQVPPSFVRPGDLIKLNYQGRLYQIGVNDLNKLDANGYLKPNSLPWRLLPVDLHTNSSVPEMPLGVPFQILRQPMRSNEAPLQLPGSAVIDLDLSGLDSLPAGKIGDGSAAFPGGTFHTVPNPDVPTPTIDTNPIVITFGPSGAIDRVYCRGGVNFRPTEPVYLLVGRREKVYPGESQESSDETGVRFNYEDTGHWFVSVGHQTGRITVTELAALTSEEALGVTPLAKSRHFARMAQSTGGR
jgi:type II secretory pathway pseudopilin PulG